MTDNIDNSRASMVTRMIVSYVDAGGIPGDSRRLKGLRYLIQMETDMDINIDYVRKKVDMLNKQKERMMHKDQLMSKVFDRELPDPGFRMGSGFCPRCRRFKNFQKECPLCSHLEMTL